MIRMWLVCRYFDRYHGRTGGPQTWYSGKIDQRQFVNHVLHEKHFKEGPTDLIIRYIHYLTGVWVLQQNTASRRLQKRDRTLDDTVAECIRRHYLLLEDSGTNLRMDDRGRRFLKPLQLFKGCLQEYDPIIKFVLGGGLGAIIVGVVWLFNIYQG